MPAAEPTVEAFTNPLARWFFATRPAFLLAAAVPVLIGLSVAALDGISVEPVSAVLTLVGAVLAHAGANVLNDYHDARNGTDARNTDRLYPFTGGSRFIQNGVLSEAGTHAFGWGLMAAAGAIGLALLPAGGEALLAVGVAGMIIGWAYSAPPLALNARGLGEPALAVAFGGLIPLGADLVQRGSFDPLVLLVALPYGLLAVALLYINQFPDRRADEAVGKHHWVVRLGPGTARWGYLMLVLGAYGSLALMVGGGILPGWALLGMLPLPAALVAAADLLRHAADPARLGRAIPLTIVSTVGHGALLALGLALAA